MLNACAVLFSGHNERAIVTLCRFFHAHNIPFVIVASSKDDAIFQTHWRAQIAMVREGASLTMALMSQVAHVLQSRMKYPVFCPTSEFLNQFVLANRQAMIDVGWHCTLPPAELYCLLSNKSSSPACIEQLIGLRMPAEQKYDAWAPPCVLKPKSNVVKGKVLYPVLCRDSQALAIAREGLDTTQWFAQEWIDGQSIYLCAYVDQSGGYDSYWQINLLQQPHGKSMVLACTGENPGVDVGLLMRGLHRLGYRGPFMMEIIRDTNGQLYFIEVNPRFWGPLNLSLNASPALLHRFAVDAGLVPQMHTMPQSAEGIFWYAWAYGAQVDACRTYPAMPEWLTGSTLTPWLLQHDVYAQPDTIILSNSH
ncbi:hypothetical protein ACHEXL_04630 [Limnohabitans sp. yimb22184]|uniref:hypothetical protein n=1 Tax=Limnohabitans sp. YIMB22184 TaxID=3374104 RepID=UPI003A89E116